MIERTCQTCGKKFKVDKGRREKYCNQKCYFKNIKNFRHSEKSKKKISKKVKQQWANGEKKVSLNFTSKGIKWSKERKKKMAKYKGEKAPNWKGGITSIHERIRKSIKFKQWRQDVYIRDNFTCQKCGQQGGHLEAHHKKSFAKLINEAKYNLPLLDLFNACMIYTPLWNINNGKTLCKDCHEKTKNFGKNIKIKEVVKDEVSDSSNVNRVINRDRIFSPIRN